MSKNVAISYSNQTIGVQKRTIGNVLFLCIFSEPGKKTVITVYVGRWQ